LVYLWREIIYSFADLQKARICHRDIRPDNIAIITLEEFENFENRKTDYSNNTNDLRPNYFNMNPRGSEIAYNYGALDVDTHRSCKGSFKSAQENHSGYKYGRGPGGSLYKQFENEKGYIPSFDKISSRRGMV